MADCINGYLKKWFNATFSQREVHYVLSYKKKLRVKAMMALTERASTKSLNILFELEQKHMNGYIVAFLHVQAIYFKMSETKAIDKPHKIFSNMPCTSTTN